MHRLRRLALSILLYATGAISQTERPITVKGSDTIGGELGPALAKAYEAAHPGSRVVWEALGSKTAFIGLLDGSADLGASSRQVQEGEYKDAQKLGVEFQEFVLGFDGISIVVNPANHVPQLTLEQVSQLYQGKIGNWKELGGIDAKVTLYGRPTYSGTRSFFDEKALRHGNAKGPEQLGAAVLIKEKNEDIIPAVAKDSGAAAYVGLGSLTNEVRAVPLVAASGQAIAPAVEHVRDGSYPLYRALYLYTRGAPAGGAAELLRFSLGAEGQKLVARSGFVPRGATEVEVAAAGPAEGTASQALARAEPVRIRFSVASVAVDAPAIAALERIAAQVKREQRHLLIVGHADASGSMRRNKIVSRARADSVAGALVKLGVPRSWLEVRGESADEPIGSNNTDEGRAQNRRVDVLVLAK